ncbi:hypothetical protein [Anaplasma marginale]
MVETALLAAVNGTSKDDQAIVNDLINATNRGVHKTD